MQYTEICQCDSQSMHSPETTAEVCDAVRQELECIDMIKYVNAILTAFVVKSPPDHEAGLSLLLQLRGPHLINARAVCLTLQFFPFLMLQILIRLWSRMRLNISSSSWTPINYLIPHWGCMILVWCWWSHSMHRRWAWLAEFAFDDGS